MNNLLSVEAAGAFAVSLTEKLSAKEQAYFVAGFQEAIKYLLSNDIVSPKTVCPYCGADVEINHDDGYGYDESDMHQQECECGKTFAYSTAIHFTYRTYKSDCLNGGEHDYRTTATYPPKFAKLRCKTCGDERLLTAKEMDEVAASTHPSNVSAYTANLREKYRALAQSDKVTPNAK